MQTMELRIKVCKKSFAGQPKYELYIPLGLTDIEILNRIKDFMEGIRKAEKA